MNEEKHNSPEEEAGEPLATGHHGTANSSADGEDGSPLATPTDEMIEAMLKDSVVEPPKDITAEVLKALPSIRRKRSFFSDSYLPRRSMIWAAFVYILLMLIVMLLFYMAMVYKMNRAMLSPPAQQEKVISDQ